MAKKLNEEKRPDRKGGIPVCPLMSAGAPSEVLCLEENCAWFIGGYRKCSLYLQGHNIALEIKMKQKYNA
ncbi:MAG: hypothetical protein ACI4CY_05890 [Candidatus Gastranaerophilaceae bacterium]